MYYLSESIGITLGNIFHPKDRLCFLVGAGISVDKPCSLPTGYDFTLFALRSLIPEEKHNTILALMDAGREGAQGVGDFLRFEQLMQYIQGWFDPDLHILDCFAVRKTPNLNHLFLAHMINLHHLVFTTNFDNMIEYSLLKTQTPKHRIVPVIYKSDWETSINENDCCVYKLHGSLLDFRTGYDCRNTLQATLEQIARMKEGNVFTLEAWKLKILQKSVQTRNLVILGYSGLDDFDILPTLWSISSSKKLIWISHDPSLEIKDAVISFIYTNNAKSCTDCDKHLNRTEGNLISFVEKKARCPDNVIMIKVNTSKLIEWLWQRYIPQPLALNTSCDFPTDNKTLVFDHDLSKLEKWLLTGLILNDHHLYSQSLKAFQTALSYSHGQWKQRWTRRDFLNQYIEESEQLKQVKLQSACFNNIGALLRRENRVDEAITFYQRSLNLAKRIDDIQGRSMALRHLGDIFEEQDKQQQALENYHQALILSESIDDPKSKATVLNHIARLRQKQKKPDALRYYKEALEINEQVGNLSGKATTLNLMGVFHYDHRKYDTALSLYHQALEINELLGNLSAKAANLFNIAIVTEKQDKLDEALAYYQRAGAIYSILGDFDGEADTKEAIISLLNKRKRPDD